MNSIEKKIPGYQILKELGHGGMATVYLAIQESLKREVAIKVMSEQLSVDPAFGERFLREATIASRLIHPHIVTIYDMGTFEGCHFISMEYVPGENLDAKIKRMQLLDIVRSIREIASALAYAGQNGYVHRDIKPENVMLRRDDGRAVLMDFGIAKACDNLNGMTQTGTTIGTPYYMSPEQARGANVDARSDLYSLGVVLFQLLAGKVPYTGDSAISVGIKHISEPVPDLPSYLQPTFQPIINKLLAKKPEDRFQSGTDLISALNALVHAELSKISLRYDAGQRPNETVFQPRISTNIWTSFPPSQSSASKKISDSQAMSGTLSSLRAEPRFSDNTATSPAAGSIGDRFRRIDWRRWHKDTMVLSLGGAVLAVITAAVLLSVFPGAPAEGIDRQIDAQIESPVAAPLPVPEQAPVEDAGAQAERLRQAQQQADIARLLALISPLETRVDADLEVAGQLKTLYAELASIEPTHERIQSGRVRIKAAHQAYLESLVEAGDYQAAADFLAMDAAVEFPELAESDIAARIQAKLTNDENVSAWLAQAGKLLEENRLSGSGQENAFAYYTRVLQIEPGNAEAKRGVDKVAEQYLTLARQYLAEKTFDQAQTAINRARNLNSSRGGEINELKSLIDEAYQKEQSELRNLRETEAFALLQAQQDESTASENRGAPAPVVAPAMSSVPPPANLPSPSTVQPPDNMPAPVNIVATVAEPRDTAGLSGNPGITTLLVQSQEFTSVDSHQPTVLVSSRTVYIGFKYVNFPQNNTVLTANLYDGGRSVRISTVPVIVKGVAGEAFFKFSQPVTGFSLGTYHLDLLMNNNTLGTYQFLIEK